MSALEPFHHSDKGIDGARNHALDDLRQGIPSIGVGSGDGESIAASIQRGRWVAEDLHMHIWCEPRPSEFRQYCARFRRIAGDIAPLDEAPLWRVNDIAGFQNPGSDNREFPVFIEIIELGKPTELVSCWVHVAGHEVRLAISNECCYLIRDKWRYLRWLPGLPVSIQGIEGDRESGVSVGLATSVDNELPREVVKRAAEVVGEFTGEDRQFGREREKPEQDLYQVRVWVTFDLDSVRLAIDESCHDTVKFTELLIRPDELGVDAREIGPRAVDRVSHPEVVE